MRYAKELETLAYLLTYPGPEHVRSALALARAPEAGIAPGAAELRAFAAGIADLSTDELEELFVRTFDLNPVCCLEAGWQLHGDRYERGMFMAEMRERLTRLGIPESGELPDHLSLVLRVLARMDEQEAAEFVTGCVGKAVEKMHVSLTESDNPYRHLIAAVREIARALDPSRPDPCECGCGGGDNEVHIALDVLEGTHG